jgi:hypothetical protein
MTRTTQGFNCMSLTDLTTQVNAYLATLTNPIIRAFRVQPIRLQRRATFQFNALITTDSGGSTIATPWTIQCFQETQLSALVTDINTFWAAVTGFAAGPQFIDVEDDQVKLNAYIAVILQNATSGASANYLPLVAD